MSPDTRDIEAALERLSSAALLREMRQTRRWLRVVVASLSFAFVALLCGCLWPCPLVRGGDFAPRVCAACGFRGADRNLDVRYIIAASTAAALDSACRSRRRPGS